MYGTGQSKTSIAVKRAQWAGLGVMCLASSVQRRYDWVEVILGGRFDAGHAGGYETLNRPDDCRHLC